MRFKFGKTDRIGLMLFTAVVLTTTLIYQFEERFTKENWERNRSTRYKMADDIIERQVLLGKTKQEIINLLGYAVFTTKNGKEILQYKLGKSPNFGTVKRETLIIYFENEKVTLVVRGQE
ncbi:hypothetical protein [Lacinutrix sp. MedPE-SW]|uniref:hypothetical protein n=1 Tax=Lacinutrix sp. MedPE-SW TaxID=1860087 RepID=UPI0009199860|nr:hypothetical protein [Lacinutrix sp. MedPE-SW]OIQ20279.1 MAG: hypothetical protein BM549_10150 [Lacinutrix sp. MedPE-SW]